MAETEIFFPDKPEVDIAEDEVSAIFTANNEEDKIPYFLQYHRDLGVTHFFAISNNSTDRTEELLAAEEDVTLFTTDASYAASMAGRLWTSEVAAHYCQDRWALVMDLDELFVYPESELIDVRGLCEYLDRQGARSMFGIFLDMYSDRPLSETIYRPGDDFVGTCPYFDGSGYVVYPGRNFPDIQVKGGPRQRLFWQGGGGGRGPAMRKNPLMKWGPQTDYLMSTHSMRPVPLSDISCAVLHFKFFASFHDLVAREVGRGDRRQPQDYAKYKEFLDASDPCFFWEESVRYESSKTLVERNYIATSATWRNFVRAKTDRWRDSSPKMHRTIMDPKSLAAQRDMTLPLSVLPMLLKINGSRRRFGLYGVCGDCLYGYYANRDAERSSVSFSIEGKEVETAECGDVSLTETRFEREIEESVFRLALVPSDGPGEAPRHARITSDLDGHELWSSMLDEAGHPVAPATLDGVVHDSDWPVLRGWACDTASLEKVEVCVFFEGQPVAHVYANKKSSALISKFGKGRGRHGFEIDLSAVRIPEESRITVVFGGTGKRLRRGRMTLAGGRFEFRGKNRG